ncbi:MAG: DUF72 domain-containing protein [Treponema sp.]|nr:DUF72 domain-containing protein [Treponema sp.]
MNELLVGTSGYDYPEWKGIFYPQDLARRDFLEYYSTKFNALELNSTFYNMPDAGRLLSFWERSHGKIKFSVKANRLLTHEPGHDWHDRALEFKAAVKPLMEKDCLSAILFQFPQSFGYSPDKRIYLKNLIDEFEHFPVAVEFRHRDWIRQSVFDGLEKMNASLVFCDMPQLKNLPDGIGCNTPFVGPQAYIRLHGRNADAWYARGDNVSASARYDYDYSDEELNQFVPVINSAYQKAKIVQIFFNNHPNGNGAKNALRIRELKG